MDPEKQCFSPCAYPGALSHAFVLIPRRAFQIQAGNISEMTLPGVFRLIFVLVFNTACRKEQSRTVCLLRRNSATSLQRRAKKFAKTSQKVCEKARFRIFFRF